MQIIPVSIHSLHTFSCIYLSDGSNKHLESLKLSPKTLELEGLILTWKQENAATRSWDRYSWVILAYATSILSDKHHWKISWAKRARLKYVSKFEDDAIINPSNNSATGEKLPDHEDLPGPARQLPSPNVSISPLTHVGLVQLFW